MDPAYDIVIDSDGTVRALNIPDLDFSTLGTLHVRRVSNVVFDEGAQVWVARSVDGQEVGRGHTKAEAVEQEVAALGPRVLDGTIEQLFPGGCACRPEVDAAYKHLDMLLAQRIREGADTLLESKIAEAWRALRTVAERQEAETREQLISSSLTQLCQHAEAVLAGTAPRPSSQGESR